MRLRCALTRRRFSLRLVGLPIQGSRPVLEGSHVLHPLSSHNDRQKCEKRNGAAEVFRAVHLNCSLSFLQAKNCRQNRNRDESFSRFCVVCFRSLRMMPGIPRTMKVDQQGGWIRTRFEVIIGHSSSDKQSFLWRFQEIYTARWTCPGACAADSARGSGGHELDGISARMNSSRLKGRPMRPPESRSARYGLRGGRRRSRVISAGSARRH